MGIGAIWTLLRILWTTQLGKIVYSALKNLLINKADPWIDELADLAALKVKEAEIKYPPNSGPKKKDEVLKFLLAHAASKGYVVGTSVLNFLIESAIQALDTLDG